MFCEEGCLVSGVSFEEEKPESLILSVGGEQLSAGQSTFGFCHFQQVALQPKFYKLCDSPRDVFFPPRS